MEKAVALPFKFLVVPNVNIELPWILRERPSSIAMFSVTFILYFFIVSGTLYNIITQTPGLGNTVNDQGVSRPEAFMRHRINGQYIMEGLASGILFCVGALGFIIFLRLENSHQPRIGYSSKVKNMGYYFMVGGGFLCITTSMFAIHIFMEMKL